MEEKNYITGVVEAVFFENASNYYKVMAVDIKETNLDYQEPTITVTGNFGDIQSDTLYRFTGHLVDHPKYGQQFQAESYTKEMPSSRQGLIHYLSSAQFPGIGKRTAEVIVDTLGDDALTLIDNDESVLDQVPHLNAKKKEVLIEGIRENYGMEQTILKLIGYGFGNQIAFRIYQAYKMDTLEMIQENPYQLVKDIRGVGFHRADELAEQLGIEAHSVQRIEAGVLHTIEEHCYQSGDMYMDLRDVMAQTKVLLEESRPYELSFKEIGDVILDMVNQGALQHDERCIYLNELYHAEQGVAASVVRLIDQEQMAYNKEEIEEIIQEIEEAQHLQYGKSQKEAIISALQSPLFVLTGGPGTGKTTIIKGIVSAYAKLNNISLADCNEDDFPIKLAAPTGRAAKRMSETTQLPACTIHRLLGLGMEEELLDSEVTIQGGLVIIDEVSMVDTQLMNLLLKAILKGTQIILVGDKNQLPSVRPGQVISDLLSVAAIPKCELNQIYRQGSESSIIPLAHDVCEGIFSADFTKNYPDRSYFACHSQQIDQMIEKIVARAQDKGFTPWQIQVLAPMYRGNAGIDHLNEVMQNLFNPLEGNKKSLVWREMEYRVGDKVLHLVNSPEENVFNGDMGMITAINLASEGNENGDEMIIDFDGNEVTLTRSDAHRITLAYCCSIHKSQGSEFKMVILPMVHQYAKKMLQRNLLYTAITRSKEKLILIGEEDVFRYCVDHTGIERKTNLAKWLNERFGYEEEQAAVIEVDEQLEDYEVEPCLTVEMVEKHLVPAMIGMNGVTPYDFLEKDK